MRATLGCSLMVPLRPRPAVRRGRRAERGILAPHCSPTRSALATARSRGRGFLAAGRPGGGIVGRGRRGQRVHFPGLDTPESGVEAAAGDELVVAAGLDDPPLLEHVDAVGVRTVERRGGVTTTGPAPPTTPRERR